MELWSLIIGIASLIVGIVSIVLAIVAMRSAKRETIKSEKKLSKHKRIALQD